jgi:NAD(P)-dependent dehydrogenase (short-subunit alcohol dehydrogenase family)
VTVVPGDVADDWHRAALASAAEEIGRLDLLVNNASTLGPSPLPRLADLPVAALERILTVDAVAPIALAQLVIGLLERSGGAIVNVTSDAGAEAYPGWGGYGGAKAALDLMTGVLAAEHPALRVVALDPGDMRTEMHQRAYPGEDISDRPEPGSVVPAILAVAAGRVPSGRHRAADLLAGVAA